MSDEPRERRRLPPEEDEGKNELPPVELDARARIPPWAVFAFIAWITFVAGWLKYGP